jgi:hypothetical protein
LVGNIYGRLFVKIAHFEKVVSEEKIFRNQPFQKQEWPVVAMFVNGSGRNEHSL